MTKKLFIIIFLIFFILFSLTLSSYASDEYSLILESNGKYYAFFPFNEYMGLDIPDMTVKYAVYYSPDIYFVLRETSYGYDFHSSSSPFYYDSASNSLKTVSSNTNVETVTFSYSKKTWSANGSTKRDISLNDGTILLSSDDITNKDGSELFFKKFVKLSPLVRTVSNIELNQSVTKEIILLLPIVLTVIITYISMRKAISFTKNKIRNA